MSPIKQRIINSLTGEEYLSMEESILVQQDAVEIIQTGCEQDADAVIYAVKKNNSLFTVVFAGRSMLQGEELKTYLEQYFSDAISFSRHLPKIVDYLYNDLRGRSSATMVLRDKENHRWRAFNPLLNIEQIYEAAGAA